MSRPRWDASPLYDAMAPFYDDWQEAGGVVPFSDLVLERVERALTRHRPTGKWAPLPALAFLDLGCGTGELLLALRHAHPSWRLVGADGSAGMLARASRKHGAETITWVVSRLDRPLPAEAEPGRFDAAGAFYDTLNHLPDADALTRAFQSAADGLAPEGLLLFDLNNDIGFRAWWRGRNTWRGRDWTITVETLYESETRVGQAHVKVERPGQAPVEGDLSERCFTREELRRALASAGLVIEQEEAWAPFALDVPGKTWFVTRKSARTSMG